MHLGDISKGFFIVISLSLAGTAVAQINTERISVSSSGVEGNKQSQYASVSADGRWVVFDSAAGNLVNGDSNNATDIFLRDRLLGTTERLSLDQSGQEVNGDSVQPVISADGKQVAFNSFAKKLVSRDFNNVQDVFVRDLASGKIARVSVSSAGVEANNWSNRCEISQDGRFVVFDSTASNLDPNHPPKGLWNVFLADRDPDGNGVFDEGNQTTELVSTDYSGGAAAGNSQNPAISGNGRYIAFETQARIDPQDTDPNSQNIYVKDRVSGKVSWISRSSYDGLGYSPYDQAPSISGDGRHVAFDSGDNFFVSGDTGRSDVFVCDRDPDGNGIFDEGNNSFARVSVNSANQAGNGDSFVPAISRDGKFVSFMSRANNLDMTQSDTNNEDDIFLRDMNRGLTYRASVGADGHEGNGGSFVYSSVSESGGAIVFASLASDIASNDNNNVQDVFIRLYRQAVSYNYGEGFPGTNGIPGLSSTAPILGQDFTLQVGNSLGNDTYGLILLGWSDSYLPTHRGYGGTILVNPADWIPVPLIIPASGISLNAKLPSDPALLGFPLFLQTLEADNGANYGVSFSAGLQLSLGTP